MRGSSGWIYLWSGLLSRDVKTQVEFDSQTEFIYDTARGIGEWKINKDDNLTNRANTEMLPKLRKLKISL